ncbi:hypothetical protein [Dongia sp. agr-C8]
MRLLSQLLIALCLIVATASAALASSVSLSIAFFATDFESVNGASRAPVSPVTGTFHVTFDPAQAYHDETNGIDATALNISVGSPLAFDYNVLSHALIIGGLNATTRGVAYGTDDFIFEVLLYPPHYAFHFMYSTASTEDSFYPNRLHGSVTQTPIPAALPLFASALGVLCIVGWHRKQFCFSCPRNRTVAWWPVFF